MTTRLVLFVTFPALHTNTEMIIALKQLFNASRLYLDPARFDSEVVRTPDHRNTISRITSITIDYILDENKQVLAEAKMFMQMQLQNETVETNPFSFDICIGEITPDNKVIDAWGIKDATLFKCSHNDEVNLPTDSDIKPVDGEEIVLFPNSMSFTNIAETVVSRSHELVKLCQAQVDSFPKEDLETTVVFVNKPIISIESINAAMQKADDEVTDPVQKSFLQRLREMVGV